jgi:predicted metal-dependent hydrolase
MKANDLQLPLFDGRRVAREAGHEWTVRASRRARRLTVRVYPGGRVEVTVPQGTRPLVVERFVAHHRSWIDARVAEFRLNAPAEPEALPERVAFRAFDEVWRVAYHPAGRRRWRVAYPGELQVHAREGDRAAALESLRDWLTDEADRRLGPWLRELSGATGLMFERVQLRRQRTRWGSCSRSGTISLNVCLMFQAPEVVRYLLVHELCHTRHMNHSPRFWRLVEQHAPDWRVLDRELLKGWRHVPSWVYGSL